MILLGMLLYMFDIEAQGETYHRYDLTLFSTPVDYVPDTCATLNVYFSIAELTT